MIFKGKPTGRIVPRQRRIQGARELQQDAELRRRGGKGGNSVAEGNFGWASTFSDISKMLDFTSQFEKRKKELNAIYDRKGGLKRQRVVAETLLHSESIVAANSWVCGVQVKRLNLTSARQWAALSWVPLFGALAQKPSDAEIASKAKSSIHGWRANPKLVWDALPWSWLADYFANTGDLLEATSNSFEYKPDNCCTMSRMTSIILDRVTEHTPGFDVTPARMVVDWKHRQPASFTWSFTSPLITSGQLVTLAGIASNWR